MAGSLKHGTTLAGFLEELGYAATGSEAAFREVLGQFEAVDERAVAQILGMMACTHKDHKADPNGLHAKLLAALGSHNADDQQPMVRGFDASWVPCSLRHA